ncbi:MAG: hypothetical protein AABW82_04895 [Nanoarchaeota archaeon]|mgnify:CR=1 FL=1
MKPKAKNLSYFASKGTSAESYELKSYDFRDKEYDFDSSKLDRSDKKYKFSLKPFFSYLPRQFDLYNSSRSYSKSENSTNYFQSGRSRSYLN